MKTSKLVCHRKSRPSCHDGAILLNVETVAPMLNAHLSRLIKDIRLLGQRQRPFITLALVPYTLIQGFPGGSVVVQNLPVKQETWV